MTYKRDQRMEMIDHVNALGEAVDKFLRKLDDTRVADKRERGGEGRPRDREGRVPEFRDLERAEERLTAGFLSMVPGLGQFTSIFQKFRTGLDDLGKYLEGTFTRKKPYYPYQTFEEKQEFTQKALERLQKAPLPGSREYMDQLKDMAKPGRVDFQTFSQGKKLAEAMVKAEKLEKVGKAPIDIFGLMGAEGMSKAHALDARGAPFWMMGTEGLSKAAAAAKSGVLPKGRVPQAPAEIPTAELVYQGTFGAIAEKLLPLAGPIGVIAGAVAAVAALPPVLRSMTAELSEGNRKYAGFNAQTAGSFAQYDVFSLQRNIEIARRTAPATVALNRARMQADAAWTDIDVMWQNTKSGFGTLAGKGAQVFGNLISPLARMADKEGSGKVLGMDLDDFNRFVLKWIPGQPLFPILQGADTIDNFAQMLGFGKVFDLGNKKMPTGSMDPIGDFIRGSVKAGTLIVPQPVVAIPGTTQTPPLGPNQLKFAAAAVGIQTGFSQLRQAFIR